MLTQQDTNNPDAVITTSATTSSSCNANRNNAQVDGIEQKAAVPMMIRPPPFEFIVECVRELHSLNHNDPQQQRNDGNGEGEEEEYYRYIGGSGSFSDSDDDCNSVSVMSPHDFIYQEAEHEADAILNDCIVSHTDTIIDDEEEMNDNADDKNETEIRLLLSSCDPMELAIVADVELIERSYQRREETTYYYDHLLRHHLHDHEEDENQKPYHYHHYHHHPTKQQRQRRRKQETPHHEMSPTSACLFSVQQQQQQQQQQQMG